MRARAAGPTDDGLAPGAAQALPGDVLVLRAAQDSLAGRRRGITMAPAIIIIALGVNPGTALVMSQVVRAFSIPFALIPLVHVTRDRRVMGPLVNRVGTTTTISVVVI